MFDKVLVPLDGSDAGESIFPLALGLAKGLRVPVTLLGVGDGGNKQALEKRLADRAASLSGAGVKTETAVVSGKPADEILKAAEKYRCDLVVVAAHTRAGSPPGTLGATTAVLLKTSQIPTLVVPPNKVGRGDLSTIIVSLDGSSLAETVLPYVEELSRRMSVGVTVVRVVKPGAAIGTGMDTYASTVELEEAAEAETAAYLIDVTARLRAAGCKAESKSLRGVPGKAIVDFVGATPNSIVAMTAHGRSGLSRWLMGSVTEEVVKSAGAPVLVIPHKYGERYAVNITQLLEQTPIFAHMRERDLKAISQTARTRTFKAGEVVVKEGEEANSMFVIAAGEVEVVKGADTPKPTVLARLSSGDFFGEMAMLDDQPRSATVKAVRDTECVTILRAEFVGEMRRHPEIAMAMLPVLVKRLRQAGDARAAATQG